MELLIVVIAFALVGIAAYGFGADTRDGKDWAPRADVPDCRDGQVCSLSR